MVSNFVKNSYLGSTPEKDKIRTLTVEFAYKFFTEKQFKRINCLTLPSAWWIFENELSKLCFSNPDNKIFPFYTACEKDYNVFCTAGINIPRSKRGIKNTFAEELDDCMTVGNKMNATLLNIEVFRFMQLSQRNNNFNFVWLDLTCPITSCDEKLPLLNKVTDKENPGIFVLTVLKARENREIKNRVEYISQLVSTMDYQLYEQYTYRDSTPMLHLIYTRKA